MIIISRTDAKNSGLKRYFTGQPCSRGHVAERTVCDHACVECGRIKSRDPSLRIKRREYMAAHQRKYRSKHPDRVRAYEGKRDKAQRAKRVRIIRSINPEPHRTSLRKSFQKHKAKRVAEARQWRNRNKERYSQHMRAAKAKRRAAEGSFTRKDIILLFEKQNSLCSVCKTDISNKYHVDHIIPLAKGGTNWSDNLQLLCRPCNQSKGSKTMEEWAAWKISLNLA